jgi:hypothetical protein
MTCKQALRNLGAVRTFGELVANLLVRESRLRMHLLDSGSSSKYLACALGCVSRIRLASPAAATPARRGGYTHVLTRDSSLSE